jgi:hypothetical protein
VGAVTWRRLGATADSPTCLVLDGENKDVKHGGARFVPHGYMTLELDGPRLTERVLLSDGTEVFATTFT